MTKQFELFEEYASYNEYVPFVSEVETFNETFGKPNNYTPVIPRDEKLINFVIDFIKEETQELEEAIENRDILEACTSSKAAINLSFKPNTIVALPIAT